MWGWVGQVVRRSTTRCIRGRPPCHKGVEICAITRRRFQERSMCTAAKVLRTSREYRTHTIAQLTRLLPPADDITSASSQGAVACVGWVAALRTFKDMAFVVLRDAYGEVQLVVSKELLESSGGGLRLESIIRVEGNLACRAPGFRNPEEPNGHVEVTCTSLKVLSAPPETGLPIQIGSGKSEKVTVSEDTRLQYRYLDIRRKIVQRNLRVRSLIARAIRNFLTELDPPFVEVETPTLFKSSPEGAREFLVPARSHGKFYALTQSPQQYKQLLMVGGVDRYFQAARCYRDEAGRADRQPEFTQIDIEMAFVAAEDVMNVAETLFERVVATVRDISAGTVPEMHRYLKHCQPPLPPWSNLTLPLQHISYTYAMLTYGSDKPDRRIGIPLQDLYDVYHEVEKLPHKVESLAGKLQRAVVFHNRENKLNLLTPDSCAIKCICVPQLADKLSKREIDDAVTAVFRALGLQTPPKDVKEGTILVAARVTSSGELKGDITMAGLEMETQRALVAKVGAKSGDLILLAAGNTVDVCKTLGTARLLMAELSRRRGISLTPHETAVTVRPEEEFVHGKGLEGDVFAKKGPAAGGVHGTAAAAVIAELDAFWVVDFPLFELSENVSNIDSAGARHIESTHHPFTAPHKDDEALLHATDVSSLLSIRGQHYDLVCNGMEVGGGSIRIHTSEQQWHVLNNILKVPKEQISGFSTLLDGLKYGAPPHGGIAFGLDRVCAILCSAPTLRDVIAFPKTAAGNELMSGSPAAVSQEQLAAYHIASTPAPA